MSEPSTQQKPRKGVDYTGVAVAYMIFDPDFNLLVHKRGKKCRDERDTWDTGSGGVDFLEDPEDAVVREPEEEYGIRKEEYTHPPQLLGVRSVVRACANDDPESHWVIFVHALRIGTVRRPIVVPDAEQDKILTPMWMNPFNALYLNLHSQVEAHLTLWHSSLSAEVLRQVRDASQYERALLAHKFLNSLSAEDRSTWLKLGIRTGWVDKG